MLYARLARRSLALRRQQRNLFDSGQLLIQAHRAPADNHVTLCVALGGGALENGGG